MLARCARVAPACIRGMPGSAYLISSFLSAAVTVTPDFSGRVSDPLAPLMVTVSADTVAVTPCGRSTGALATLDMLRLSRSRHDAQDFAALADGARLLVGHHALGRGHDHGAHAAQNLRQLVLAAIDAQPRTADTLQAVDDGPALVILQAHGERRLAAVVLGAEVGDVALILQYLEDGHLHLRGGELHFALAGGLAVADAGQQVCDRISHAHTAALTSSPSPGQESRRGWRPPGSSRATGRTCGTRPASGR